MMPVIILGGIYSGIFTPTEAAAVLPLFTARWSDFSSITNSKKR